jgi:hypothetical protein
MAWYRPRADAGDEMDLKSTQALKLLQRGVVEAVKQERERAIPEAPERAVTD